MFIIAAGILLSFGHWWLYFTSVGRRLPHGKYLYEWNYLHLPLAIAFTCIGAVLSIISLSVGDAPLIAVRLLIIFASAAIITIGLIETLIVKEDKALDKFAINPVSKYITGLVCLILLFFTGVLSPAQITLILFFIAMSSTVFRIIKAILQKEKIILDTSNS